MRLATQCPFCHTTFRVIPEQLTLRGGLVRCGHCKEVFDGNQYLVPPDLFSRPPTAATSSGPTTPAPESSQSTATTPSNATAPGSAAPSDVPPWMTANLAETFATVAAATSDAPWGAPSETAPPSSVTPSVQPLPLPTVSADQQPAVIEPKPASFDSTSSAIENGELPTPVTEVAADTATPTKQQEPGGSQESAAHIATAEETLVPVASEQAELASPLAVDPVNQATREEGEGDAEKNPEKEDTELPGFVQRAERRARLARIARACMAVGIVLLVITLLLQMLYLGRNQLVIWLPATREPLSAMCERLHCRIGLPSDIEQLSLESSELQLVPPNQNIYTLNLLLRNRSASAETWPYIELTINDADDQPIIRRIFPPKEYLTSLQQVSDGFAGEAEQPVKLTFELTQTTAVGYRVYLFYP